MLVSYGEIIRRLEELSNPAAVQGMSRYGITPARAYGVSVPELRSIVREAGRNHELAGKLWALDTRETRILASMIEEPKLVTERQMEGWVKEFDNWEICDQCCLNLFRDIPLAWRKCTEWSSRKEEFVKRAGFVLIACMAVGDKKTEDVRFEKILCLIEREAEDERKMVKRAVNWALREIGKRNSMLNRKALASARRIRRSPSRSARWVASDAIRELTSEKVRRRLQRNPERNKAKR